MLQAEYITPTTLEDTLNILACDPQDTKLIAGGTDLVPQMRTNMINPRVLINLKSLPLDRIQTEDNYVSIGSCVTHAQIICSAILQERFPAFVNACNVIGGPATRNQGTVGGNLVNASPAADTAPPLLAYDATVVLSGKGYERTLLLSDFFRGYHQTALQPGEMLKEIALPVTSGKTVARYIKMGNRHALTVSVVNVAVCITLGEDDLITKARIALGSVAPTPFRAKSAEDILTKRYLNSELIAEAAYEVSGVVNPISDIRASADYRKKMVGVLVRRALEEVREELLGARNHE